MAVSGLSSIRWCSSKGCSSKGVSTARRRHRRVSSNSCMPERSQRWCVVSAPLQLPDWMLEPYTACIRIVHELWLPVSMRSIRLTADFMHRTYLPEIQKKCGLESSRMCSGWHTNARTCVHTQKHRSQKSTQQYIQKISARSTAAVAATTYKSLGHDLIHIHNSRRQHGKKMYY